MTGLVTRNYWWLGVIKDVRKYIDEYDIYQKMKNRIKTPVEKLKLTKILKKLWMYLIVDFTTKLLLVVGKDTILVVCDRLFKMMYFVATTERTLAERLARLFRNNT